eukprot:366202-Chlamydomonas_euryale.AAC.2
MSYTHTWPHQRRHHRIGHHRIVSPTAPGTLPRARRRPRPMPPAQRCTLGSGARRQAQSPAASQRPHARRSRAGALPGQAPSLLRRRAHARADGAGRSPAGSTCPGSWTGSASTPAAAAPAATAHAAAAGADAAADAEAAAGAGSAAAAAGCWGLEELADPSRLRRLHRSSDAAAPH